MFLHILFSTIFGIGLTAYFPAESDYSSCYGDENPTCDDNWTLLIRPQGGWCIQFVSGTVLYEVATTECEALNATVSGIQYPSEIATMQSLYYAVYNVSAGGRVWIGGYRTNACLTSKLTTTCNQTNSFYWTDGFTTGTAGFVWGANQPDNDNSKGQLCPYLSLVMINGTLDDIPDVTGGNFGVICGKQANNTS